MSLESARVEGRVAAVLVVRIPMKGRASNGTIPNLRNGKVCDFSIFQHSTVEAILWLESQSERSTHGQTVRARFYATWHKVGSD